LAEKQPPDWGTDPFSTFFADAEFNCRASAVNLAPVYSFLQTVNTAFRRMSEAIENDNSLLLSRFLMVRTHSAFLAACRLAMSGQPFECCVVLRGGIEQAWYSLHIAKNPALAETWLRRNDSDNDKAKCKSEFTVAKIRSTHEQLDAATAKNFQLLYETLIDYGAHPNPKGVLMALSKSSETSDQRTFKIGILIAGQLTMGFALWLAAAVAIGALKVFQLIYPERFKKTGLDLEIEKLIPKLNSIFQKYRLPAPPSGAAT